MQNYCTIQKIKDVDFGVLYLVLFNKIPIGSIYKSFEGKWVSQVINYCNLEKKFICSQDIFNNRLSAIEYLLDKNMEIQDYPLRIAITKKTILQCQKKLDDLINNINLIEFEVDKKIAFDTTLKNDFQRKVKRKDYLDSHPNYWELQHELKAFRKAHETAKIELTQEEQEFSVAKLIKREAIATLEKES